MSSEEAKKPSARAVEKKPGRLASRPSDIVPRPLPGGRSALGLGDRRDGLVYVPKASRAGQPAPLVVLLHGAGGSAAHGVALLEELADAHGLVLLAPDSRGSTWDAIRGDFGPDVDFLDAALARVFEGVAIDPGKVAVGGFSDGASYALSLGLTNGDLFSSVVAFSPGFAAPAERVGEPRFFVSHGTDDRVLGIDACSRRVVPALRRAGYDVTYREFEGGHAVPREIALEAVRWWKAEEP